VKTLATLTMNPSLDLTTSVRRIVPVDKMRCSPPTREPGGGGINVARAFTHLGGEASAYYPAGDGTGHIISKMLKKERITDRPQPSVQLARESFTVFDESSGKQYRFVLPGPKLCPGEWRRCLDAITSESVSDFLVVSGSLPPGVPSDFYANLARRLHDMPTRLVLDTSGDPLHKALEAGGIDLLKPNRRELETFCGFSLQEEEQERVCRELVDSGVCRAVVLTLGAEGALLTTPDGQKRVAALSVEVVSAVGAGDSFVAGMCVALCREHGMVEAFLYGMAAATAALVTPGTGLCRKEQTDFFFRRLQEREGAS